MIDPKFASAFSALGLAHKLFQNAERQGHTLATLNALAESSDLLRSILAVLEGRSRIVPIEVAPVTQLTQAVQTTLTVPPSFTTLERIALGAYDWKNGDITDEWFPHDATTVGEWEYDLFYLNRDISSEDAKLQAEVDGWTVAKAEHLFAFGQAFPELQRKFPIIALGFVCRVRSKRSVLGLSSFGGERGVGLSYCDGGWRSYCRFLRVRKVLKT